jgi:hypothetical protein
VKKSPQKIYIYYTESRERKQLFAREFYKMLQAKNNRSAMAVRIFLRLYIAEGWIICVKIV